MAHPLSTQCNMQHGLANAICLPHVMLFNRDVCASKYALVAHAFGTNTRGMTSEEAADKAIEAVKALNERIGIPTTLADAGVKEEQLSLLSKEAFQDSCHQANPRPCTEEDMLALFKSAFHGA